MSQMQSLEEMLGTVTTGGEAPALTVLDEAAQITSVDRQKQYGPPEDSFDRIARYWSVYLDDDITAEDVAHLMILMKVAREQHAPKRDNLVDIAGYARCAEMIQDNERKP